MLYSNFKTVILALVAIGVFGISPVAADEAAEKEAIIAVVDEFFDAMQRRDAATWERLMLPDAMAVIPLINRDGEQVIRYRSNADSIAGFAPEGPEYVERYWDPVILVHDPIAVLWAPYDFHLDGEFSHCGIDLFELVKVEGEWKLSNASWTQETDNCPESPLGPLTE